MKKWKLVAVTQLLLIAIWLIGASPSQGAKPGSDAKGPECVDITQQFLGRAPTEAGVPSQDRVRVVIHLDDPYCADIGKSGGSYLVELWEANDPATPHLITSKQSPDARETEEIDQDGDGIIDDRTGKLRFDFTLPLGNVDDRLCVQSQAIWENHVADYSPDLVNGQKTFSRDPKNGGLCIEATDQTTPPGGRTFG